VEDELQYHSIGCYSVVHELKSNMRRAEHGLASAENVIHTYPEEAPDNASKNIDEAWKKTLFNQFHDIYAGTSLGSARDTGDSIIYSTLFRKMGHLPKDPFQRIVAFNISGQMFSGYLQHEPWILWRSFDGWLADENGQRVPYQRVQQETVSKDRRRLIWPAEIPPAGFALIVDTDMPGNMQKSWLIVFWIFHINSSRLRSLRDCAVW